MKTILPKHIYAILIINLLLLTSCDKSDNTEIPEPIDQPSCKLINNSSPDGNFNVDFEYNSKGFLVKETMVSKSATTLVTYVKVLTYNSSNQLLKFEETKNGQIWRSVTFEYKDGRVFIEKSYDASGSLRVSKEYIYGPNNRIIREAHSDGSVREYTYGANGNIAKLEISKDGFVSVKQTFDNHDNSHNIFRSIQGFYNIYALISPNNPRRETLNFYTNGIDDYEEVLDYSYKYNSDGWPIEKTITDVETGHSRVLNYTYDCN